MTDLDAYDLFGHGGPRPGAAPTRKCRRHAWQSVIDSADPTVILRVQCSRCTTVRDETARRRNVNNRKRGTSDELAVARLLGGRKVGPLGHPWDVEIAGYLRAQCKKTESWPSLNAILAWLDAIPAGRDLRMVTLADTPGPGGRTRRIGIVDLDEFAGWHGKAEAA